MTERLPVALVAGALGLLIGLPLLALAAAALELNPVVLADGLLSALPQVANSAWTALAATALALVAGTALALLTERSGLPTVRLLRLLVALALLLPGYVAAIAWLRAYGPAGLLDTTLGLSLPGIVGPLGIVLVLGVEQLPICYLVAVAGLALRAEPDTERAARASGASALTSLRTVTLPLLRPTLAAAAVISFVLSLTAFGVPAVLGIPAGFSTMTTLIYRDLAFSADPAAFARAIALALLLASAAAAAIGLADRLLGRRDVLRTGVAGGPLAATGWTPSNGRRRVRPRWSTAGLAGLLTAWLVVALTLLVPLGALLLTALTRAPGLPPIPANLTLDNFAVVLDRHALDALINSSLLSAAAAAGVLVLSGLLLLAGRGRRTARLGGGFVALAFALPGSTLALAMLLAYGPLLRDTLAIILLAYLAKFWLLGHRPLAAAMGFIAADALRAARISGATAWAALRTVVLPLMRPAILAGSLLVFLFGMHEITMSSLLYGPGTATLAVAVLNLQQLGDPTRTAALATLLALMLAVIGLPALRWLRVLEGGAWRR